MSPVVSLNHVTFIRSKKVILEDISLCINRGEHWAIVGQNGSGKTSLVSIINGYHRPSRGEAFVLGKKFGTTDLRELRRHIGVCSSEIRDMIHNQDSVKDIILSGRFASIGLYESPDAEDHQRASELMDFFGLSKMSDRAFDTLSNGEQQKTILARALIPEPALLVLDEPGAGLDLRSREELLNAVRRMCTMPGGPTLIFVTHHIEEIMPVITHALALRNGRVVAQGRKEDVLESGILTRTFDVPIELYEKGGRLWPVVSDSNSPGL
ncbi:putative branched-chain amino acid transport ATP-binding protein LivG [uncultured archaeon]|nr:putative branched-chain amino acid transport ATP-binding protein LivG [uncultured archaeon]